MASRYFFHSLFLFSLFFPFLVLFPYQRLLEFCQSPIFFKWYIYIFFFFQLFRNASEIRNKVLVNRPPISVPLCHVVRPPPPPPLFSPSLFLFINLSYDRQRAFLMICDIAVLAVGNRSIVRISSSPSALNRILSSHRITTWTLRRGGEGGRIGGEREGGKRGKGLGGKRNKEGRLKEKRKGGAK